MLCVVSAVWVPPALFAVQLANTTQSINNESGHITEYETHLFSHPGESPPLGLQIFLTFSLSYTSYCQAVCLYLFKFLCCLSNTSTSDVLLFSPLSWCLCSHRNWQIFWRSVTWCSQACSVWRCCWSSWLWGSLATSKTHIMASTASLSSSGEVLMPSAPRLCAECSPGLFLALTDPCY